MPKLDNPSLFSRAPTLFGRRVFPSGNRPCRHGQARLAAKPTTDHSCRQRLAASTHCYYLWRAMGLSPQSEPEGMDGPDVLRHFSHAGQPANSHDMCINRAVTSSPALRLIRGQATKQSGFCGCEVLLLMLFSIFDSSMHGRSAHELGNQDQCAHPSS